MENEENTSLASKLGVKSIEMYWAVRKPLDTLLSKFGLPTNFCRFKPTCSHYTTEAIEKYGFVKGTGKGLARIARCNPFSKGGYDPLE